ncbi:MAG TPA: hypothetical protein DD435_01210 [Cyanobacteria bacterium UBA8530]|nr:hypothetical protein [Cyanobacteria bacterium UBA8530]
MPRIWLPNLEDAFLVDDYRGRAGFLPKVKTAYSRCLFWLRPGDVLILPAEIEQGFADYVATLSALPAGSFLPHVSFSHSLVDSILMDEQMLQRLREFAKKKKFSLEPYIETSQVVLLSQATGLPLRRTSAALICQGLIDRLNDKSFFKLLSRELGVEAVPSYFADNMSALEQSIERTSRENQDQVMVKKVQASGGLGNLAGNKEQLLKALPEWYQGGSAIVEPLLDFVETAGSLVLIEENECRLMGIDRQRFEKGKWTGFDYPHPSQELSERLGFLSMRYARAIQKIGGRGFLNLDWGILPGEKPLAIELNFRHNGFGHILHFIEKHFGPRMRAISYIEGFETGNLDFQGLLALLDGTEFRGRSLLVEEEGRERGVIVFMPPRQGKAALAFVGDSLEECREMKEKLEKVLP